MGAVSSAKGNLVAGTNACFFKKDMQFFNFACHILILQGASLIIGKGVKVPVVLDAAFKIRDEIFVLRFHSMMDGFA